MASPTSIVDRSKSQAIQSPVFLVGAERSGTTLLRLMLDHHPQIAFNAESEFLVSHVSDAGDFPDVAAYRRMLLEDRVFRHSRFHIDDGLDFPALAHDFLRQKLVRDGKSIVGATVHYGFSKLRYIWPDARYIYLLRDGRDVASSVVLMGWAGNSYVAADWWLNAESEWSEFRAGLTTSQWIEVRYEDLTTDATAQLGRVCDFIGVAYSPKMFDYARTSTYSLPDAAQNFKWRREMSRRELRLLEARIGGGLARRGYELSAQRVPHIGRMSDRWLRLQSRANALRHRVKAFGLRLVFLEFASRRLHWMSMHSSTRRTINAIIDQNLK